MSLPLRSDLHSTMETPPLEPLTSIAARYRRFAAVEARGRSPSYEALANAAADNDVVLQFLSTLPEERRQPNLFLAAVRWVLGNLPKAAELDQTVVEHGEAIRQTILTRRTQTNEPARCAVLMPVLAGLAPPLALLEVGASAGLCLLPDHYSYDYGRQQVPPAGVHAGDAPLFKCSANDDTPLPEGPLSITWRRGLDLNPLNMSQEDDRHWLETLVWPEQTERLDRLTAAMAIARRARPTVTHGNLLQDLERIAAEAPKNATLVIFHTAVLSYVATQSERQAFAKTVRALDAHWISNEAPTVFPEHATGALSAPQPDAFLLALDGKPLAWTGPHGQSIHWFS